MQVLFYNYHKSVAKIVDAQNLIPHPIKTITQHILAQQIKKEAIKPPFFRQDKLSI